jgi:hypothetical protein
MRYLFATVALLCAATAAPAKAQADQEAPASEAPASNMVTTSPDNDPRGGFLNSGFQLRADTDATSAQVTLATDFDTPGVFGNTEIGITFNAPINKKSKEGPLLTDRGLPGGFAGELAITSFLGTARPPPEPIQRGFLSQHRFLISVAAGLGVEDFEFLDPQSFSEDEVRKTSYYASAVLGILPRDSATFFSIGGEYRRSYKAPDQRILCPPSVAGSPIECTQAIFGPPARNIDENLFGSLRTLNLFGLTGARSPFVLEVKAAYDLKDDVVGLEIPIYALLDAKGQFRGGVRFGWDSDKDDVRVGLFVGVPFSFTGFRE